ncbi:MAG: hypothetical protein V3V14_01210 [Saprospiraceae bacterium]
MNEAKKEVKKTLTFDNSLTGSISIDRDTLVKNIETEHRSYANYSLSIDKSKSFSLPELEKQYPSGFSLGIVIHLKDNANPDNAKKTKMSL